MISTYVRRLRLATELRKLREERDVTSDQLAKMIGGHRPTISRLENGLVAPRMGDVVKILQALGVDGERWEEIVKIAREAAESGWWESSAKAMGERQAQFADLEAGATGVREFQQGLIPGLMQTPEYVRARLEAIGWVKGPAGSTPEGIADGRLTRQRMLQRLHGPTYELILDEVVIRRPSAPPAVMAHQLRYLAGKSTEDKFEIRVLPVEAVIGDYRVPTSSFSIYVYPDDPAVVAIEGVVTDSTLTAAKEVERHVTLYGLLQQACLTREETTALLIEAADRLPPGT
jgi:transcriptional regulator with XRE-family HTH domain